MLVLVTAAMIGKYLHQDTKDAPVWYDVGRRVLAGRPLVGLTSYRYPPTFAVLIAPLCALPFAGFFFVWYTANVALFFAALKQTARLTGGRAAWPVALVAAVYAVDNLFLGQTNLLVMVLLYGSFLYLLRGREWASGAPLGLSIAVKVFTLPVVFYLLYRRRWRAAASTVLSCLFFLLLFPAPVRGLRRNAREVREWGRRVVEPYLSQGKAGDWGQHALDFGNQSLQAVAHRWLTRVDANVAARRGAPIYVNFVRLSESQVNRVVLAAFALLALVFLAACGRRAPETKDREAAEYALVTIGLLLVSAIAWTYFFVMMLLPLAVAWRLVGRGYSGGYPHGPRGTSLTARISLQIALAAFFIATALLRVHYLRALGSLCLTSLALYLALAAAVWDMRKAP